MQMTLPLAVYVIWGLTLALVALVIVPVALILLHRTLLAAMSIRRYFAEMLEAAVGIAGHVQAVSALEDTLGTATAMVQAADGLAEHSAALGGVLTQRAEEGPSS